MNKYWALLVVVSLPVSAKDVVLAGRLEGVTRTSISIRMADGRAVDAVLPAGIAGPYSAADQVEITCAPAKTVYDAQAALHFHLLVKSLRLVRLHFKRDAPFSFRDLSCYDLPAALNGSQAAGRRGPLLDRYRLSVNLAATP